MRVSEGLSHATIFPYGEALAVRQSAAAGDEVLVKVEATPIAGAESDAISVTAKAVVVQQW